MQLKIKKMFPDVVTPTYGTTGAACFDIYFYDYYDNLKEPITITSWRPAVFTTGLKFNIPEGFVLKIYSRSGHGFNSDVRLSNCTGIIDSDYTGELKIKLCVDSDLIHFRVSHGDRIAQGMLVPVEQVQFLEILEVKETDRGSGGFGSTGV